MIKKFPSEVEKIVEQARAARAKRAATWQDYELCKRALRDLNLSSRQYEIAVTAIVEALQL